MKTSDFYYDLPEELIAQTPIDKRDDSRLLVYDRKAKTIAHKHFYDVINYLNPGDTLVLNNTQVIPARLLGEKEGTGGKMEFLLLKKLEDDCYETLVKPGKRANVGDCFLFGGKKLRAKILSKTDSGGRVVRFFYEGLLENILDEIGEIPLPPYIKTKLSEKDRYQTVYARKAGSAAAPTAGLHFTDDLLHSIKAKGVHVVYVLLHVGLGTFRPVNEENIEDHVMHSEYYEVSAKVCSVLNETREQGGRVVAVGTTCARVLETISDDAGKFHPQSGSTNIFIYPGVKTKGADMLITNFHLPCSTLLMLVSAFMGREEALDAYAEAIDRRYRFFSFGDAMMIL